MKCDKVIAITAVLLLLASLSLPVGGRADQTTWSRPVNLSRSGAASEPTVIRAEDGNDYVFWWDRYDGLTVARRSGDEWDQPLPVPVVDNVFDASSSARINTQTGQNVTTVIREGGVVTLDGSGGVSAFFLAESDASEAPALRQAQASLADLEWTEPVTVVSSVSSWRTHLGPDGVLHLVVFYAGRSADLKPGVYYLRSTDGGTTWSDMTAVSESLYVRRAEPRTSHISLAVGPSGALYVAWNEPGTGRALWSWSPDNGASWTLPQQVNPQDRIASYAHVAVTGDGNIVLLWQGSGTGDTPSLYSRYSADGGYNWTAPQPVLAGFTGDSANLALATNAAGQVTVAGGGQQGGPALTTFGSASGVDGQPGWADPQKLAYPGATTASLTASDIERWSSVSGDGRLTLVGADEAGDIWALVGDVSAIPWTYSGTAIWSDEGGAANGRLEVVADSGAASPPTVMDGTEGARQAYWWNSVEGLMSARYDGTRWFSPQAAQAYTSLAGASTVVPPYGAVLASNSGTIGAFWIDGDTGGEGALLFSQQAPGQHTWAAPTTISTLAQGVLARTGTDGSYHVLYSRVTSGENEPAGVYYASRPADGTEWSVPVLVSSLPAAEGLQVPTAQLGFAIGANLLHATWQDPTIGAVMYSRSSDRGLTWSTPLSLSDSLAGAGRPSAAALGERGLVVFESPVEGGIQLNQAYVDEAGALTGSAAPLRRIEAGGPATGAWALVGQGTDQLLLTVVESPGALTVSRRVGDGAVSGWESPHSISLVSAVDGASSEPIALATSFADGRLVVTSVGVSGEAGVLDVPWTDSGWSLSEQRSWSWPQRIGALEAGAGTPVIQIDEEHRLHVMWSAGPASAPGLWYARRADGNWTEPAMVIQPQEGVAQSPSLVALGERLYAAWSGGDNGRIDGAGAFAADAYAAASWPLAEALPAPIEPRNASGANPSLTVDLSETLHAVYAVPINQLRGVYYTRSADAGETWASVMTVFDAAAAGWPVVDEPAVAVDHDGTVYVAWLRLDLAGGAQPRALYLGRSRDGGRTWSEPRLVAEGAFASPTLVIATTGQPHLLWQDAGADRGVWHSWSADSGDAWSLPMRVRGLASLSGAAGVVADGQGAVYLAAITQEDNASDVLQSATWDSTAQQWALDAASPLTAAVESASDIALAIAPETGQLAAVILADIATTDGTEHVLLHRGKDVPARSAAPVWTGDRGTEVVPETAPDATPRPTARPTIDVTAPPDGGGAMEVGPLTVPLLSIGGLVLVALLVAGVMIARGRSRR